MKLFIAILLACILGAVLANAFNSAIRDVTKVEKATCRAKVML